MNAFLCIATFLVPFFFSASLFATQMDLSTATMFHQNPGNTGDTANDHLKHSSTNGLWRERENKMENRIGDSTSDKVGSRRGRRTIQIAGSRLPNCMHACGSCSPCRLVTISFACTSLTEEAESCPISYRCMCNSKSYPIP